MCGHHHTDSGVPGKGDPVKHPVSVFAHEPAHEFGGGGGNDTIRHWKELKYRVDFEQVFRNGHARAVDYNTLKKCAAWSKQSNEEQLLGE